MMRMITLIAALVILSGCVGSPESKERLDTK